MIIFVTWCIAQTRKENIAMFDVYKFNCIIVEVHDKIAVVTLNMPEQMNVFDSVMHKEMESLFGQLGADESINSVVLTGAGKMFSAGGDIKMMQGGAIPPPEEAISLINNLLRVKQPIIAAVNGHAMGFGATIALFCDIVIASEEAKIGDPHVKVGLVAGDGGCVIWPLLIGINKAKEIQANSILDTAEELPVVQNKPNIYYFILDMYSSNSAIKELSGYDNSQFTKRLESMGFTVCYDSESNYYGTQASMASSLNMRHLTEQEMKSTETLFQLIRGNKTARMLRDTGYKYIFLTGSWSSSAA